MAFTFYFHLKTYPPLRSGKKIGNINFWGTSSAGLTASKIHQDTLYDVEEDARLFEERFLHHLFVVLRFPYRKIVSYIGNFDSLSEMKEIR